MWRSMAARRGMLYPSSTGGSVTAVRFTTDEEDLSIRLSDIAGLWYNVGDRTLSILMTNDRVHLLIRCVEAEEYEMVLDYWNRSLEPVVAKAISVGPSEPEVMTVTTPASE